MPLTQAISIFRFFRLAALAIVLPALLAACSGGGNDDTADDGPPPSRDWVLVWSDEFEGTELNLDNWEYQLGDGRAEGLRGWGNNEEQYYTEDAVSVAGGNLIITSMADNPVVDPAVAYESSYDYSSGRIRTQGKFDFTYGRVEARIQMPDTLGIWNAFWLLGSDPTPYGNWAARGEIDIVEAWQRGNIAAGTEPFISGAAHYGGPFPFNTFRNKAVESFDHFNDFHIYAVEWDAEQIRWFLDGVNFFSLRSDNYWNYYQDAENGFQPGGDNAPFDQNFHIILNAAIGGTLPTSANELPDPAILFGEMLVDYVRVYNCPFDPVGGTGCKNSTDMAEESLAYEFPVDNSFSALLDLYIDGPGAEDIPVGRSLEFVADNGLVLTEQSDPADPSNNYFDIVAPGVSGGNVPVLSLVDAMGENFILAGFTPNGLGDIKFDIYVESDSVNPNGNLRISIISGASRSSVILPINTFAVDAWERVNVPIQDILISGPNGIDVGAITELVRFEFSDAHVRLDNIQLACGGQVCGIVDEVPVYIDAVEAVWDRGIVGNDSIAISMGNADYSESTGNHVSWREVDTGDPLHNTVVETTFGTSGADGAVNFIGSTMPVPSIAALTQGEFSFDIRMISNPNNVELLFKVDAVGSTTGEQPLGDLVINEWTRFTCPIATLTAQGLDTSKVAAPFVLVPGNQGAGQDIVVQWDNITFSPLSTGNATPLNLPLVFDSLPGFCLPVQPFAGGAFAIVANPGIDGVNANSRVGKITKFDPGNGDLFGGVAIRLTNPVTFAGASSRVGKAFTIKVYSTRIGLPITFKLESSPGVGPARSFTTNVANAWEEFEVDFNGEGSGSFPTITLIVDDGVAGDGGDNFTVHIDDINQIDSTSVSADLNTVYNFDAPNTTYTLTDFGEARSSVGVGPLDGGGMPEAGTDGLVGQVRLETFATSFAGTILGGVDGFANPIPFTPTRTTVRMRVWTPAANTAVELKVEDAEDPDRFASDLQFTAGAGWQTLDFDFSAIEQMETFELLVLVFEPGTARTGIVYYFDDVELLP